MADEKGEQQYPYQGERIQRPEYLDARRYESEEPSRLSYTQVQEIMRRHHEITDLSVYRVRPGPVFDWHVVVLGEAVLLKPLLDAIEAALDKGEPVDIPDDLLAILLLKREEGKRRGGWSEKHYRPGQGVY
jgi:hypothetical protein